MSNVVAMTRAPLAEVPAARPFFSQGQLSKMTHAELVACVLGMQTRTHERMTREGPMVCTQRLVPLAYGRAEDIFEIEKMGVIITAKGYNKIAMHAGVQFIPVETVIVDNTPMANGYVERNPITKSNLRCWVRNVAVWRGPNGTFVGHDLTLCYDPGALFLVALRGKAQYNPADILSVRRRLDEPCKDGWAFFPEMDIPGTEDYVGLYVNLANKDVGACIKDRTDKSKFIERYARTFCRRNLIKTLMSINVPDIKDDDGKVMPIVTVPVTAWLAPSDEPFSRSVHRAVMGAESSGDVIGSVIRSGTISASIEFAHDDGAATHDATIGDEDAEHDDAEGRQYLLDAPQPRTEARTPQPAPVDPAPVTETPAATQAPQTVTQAAAPVADRAAHIAELKRRLAAARAAIGDGPYQAACAGIDLDPSAPGAKGMRKLEELVTECEDMAGGGAA